MRVSDDTSRWLRGRGVTTHVEVEDRYRAIAEVCRAVNARDPLDPWQTLLMLYLPQFLDQPRELVDAVSLYAPEVRSWVVEHARASPRLASADDFSQAGAWRAASAEGAVPPLKLVGLAGGEGHGGGDPVGGEGAEPAPASVSESRGAQAAAVSGADPPAAPASPERAARRSLREFLTAEELDVLLGRSDGASGAGSGGGPGAGPGAGPGGGPWGGPGSGRGAEP